MNQWIGVAVAVALALGAALGLIWGGQISQTTPPALYKTIDLQQAFETYRNAIYPIEPLGAEIVTIPDESWMSKYGSSALVVKGRMLYKGRVMGYKLWRAFTDGGVSDHPFLLQFDLNGDGAYSADEGYVLTGDPVVSAPIPLATYLEGGGK